MKKKHVKKHRSFLIKYKQLFVYGSRVVSKKDQDYSKMRKEEDKILSITLSRIQQEENTLSPKKDKRLASPLKLDL